MIGHGGASFHEYSCSQNFGDYQGQPYMAEPQQRYLLAANHMEEKSYTEESDDQSSASSSSCSLWLFLLTLAGLLWVLVTSTVSGRISVLSHPLNYRGLACGWDDPVRHLPYVYYPLDPKDGKKVALLATRPMCVQRCPDIGDVEKKAYISISDASAVNVGKSLALLSVLHSVRSPVYASEPNFTGYCVPQAPPLKDQLENILATETVSHSYLRSIAATLISALPGGFAAMLIACLASFTVATLLLTHPNVTLNYSFLAAGGILLLTGIRGAVFHGQWASCVLCTTIAAGIVGSYWHLSNRIKEGEALISTLNPFFRQVECLSGFLVAAHVVMTSIIYSTLVAFCFLQTNASSDEGSPLNFSLDPNGGLKIYPLEKISTESSSGSLTRMFQTLFVLGAGFCLLETTVKCYQGLCVLVTFQLATENPDERTGESPASVSAAAQVLDHIGTFWIIAMCSLIGRITVPLTWLMRSQPGLLGVWVEKLDMYSYTGSLLKYLFDIAEQETNDTRLITSYRLSAQTAYKIKEANEAASFYLRALGAASAATLGCKFFMFATTFMVVNTMMLFVNEVGGSLTIKAPLSSSLLITVLYMYVANVGLAGYTASVDALMYLKELSIENYTSNMAADAVRNMYNSTMTHHELVAGHTPGTYLAAGGNVSIVNQTLRPTS